MGHEWVFWWVLVGCAIYGLWNLVIKANDWLLYRAWMKAEQLERGTRQIVIDEMCKLDVRTSPDGVEWTSRPATMFSGQLFKDGCEWTPRHCDFGNGRLDVLPIEFDDLDDLSRLL